MLKLLSLPKQHWSQADMIGVPTFQRSVTKKPRVSPDTSS